MPNLLIVYTTYDGHTAAIVERIASTARRANCAVELCDLARSRLERRTRDCDGVNCGGSLYGGKHPRQLAMFVLSG